MTKDSEPKQEEKTDQGGQQPDQDTEMGSSSVEYRMPAPLRLDVTDLLPEWLGFKQRFQIFLTAAGLDRVVDARKVAIFLNTVGHDAQELYFNVLKKEETTKYEDIIKIFDKHFATKQNELINAYTFNQRKQEDGESFDFFYTELRKLVKNCSYKDQEDRMLRDRIVIGVTDKKLQQKLLAVSDLTLDKAVDMCRASELSKTQVKMMQQQATFVDAIKRQPGPEQQYKKDKYYTNNNNYEDNSVHDL